ncbi:cytochrome b [Vibrio sp. HN007]|uniref:cytochrome b n=1 Tax=Vibrio iocasae TaxID=3098914 RepID=UPI0035D4E63A
MNTKDKLSLPTVVLHGVVAILMIYMLVSGLIMEDLEQQWFFDSHTSIGAVIALVVVPRVIVRIFEGWPKPVGEYTKLEKNAGKIVHWILIVSTILMPLSGIMMAIGGGHGLSFFAWEIVAALPEQSGEVSTVYPLIEEFGDSIHSFVGSNLLPVALILHVAGAIKHHMIDKDRTLVRMMGK